LSVAIEVGQLPRADKVRAGYHGQGCAPGAGGVAAQQAKPARAGEKDFAAAGVSVTKLPSACWRSTVSGFNGAQSPVTKMSGRPSPSRSAAPMLRMTQYEIGASVCSRAAAA